MIIDHGSFSKISINDLDPLCQHYLNVVYRDIHHKLKTNKLAETQGEILYEAIDKLLATLCLTNDDVFVDLGSGSGKIIAQVFLKTIVKEAIGIEFVPELHQQALAAAQRIQHDLPELYSNGRKLTFLLSNFLKIPLDMATVIIINSTCMSQQTLSALGHIINQTPSIRSVLTLRPIPTLQRLQFKKIIRIECSWDAALCFVYD